MKIESKFNVGEEVWFISDNKVRSEIIQIIQFPQVSKARINGEFHVAPIEYKFDKAKRLNTESRFETVKEENVFATKEDLIKSI